MSDFVRLCVALGLAFTAACASPDERLDDFRDRVVDAAVNDRPDAEVLTTIPDVTGTFLVGINPSATPGSFLPFLATFTLIDGTTDQPKLDVHLQPLNAANLQPTGDPIDAVESPVAVSLTGEYTIAYDDAIVPAETNANSGTQLTVDMTLTGLIRSEDEVCGFADGMVVAPFNLTLDGSTFGARRVPDGTDPSELELIGECTEDPTPDAGVPDAMPPDAMLPDAGAADAMPAGDGGGV